MQAFQYLRTAVYVRSQGHSFVHFYLMERRKRMLRVRWFAVAVTALVPGVLCGCGGGGAQKVLYALGLGSPNVTIFTISNSGGLTATDSVTTGSAPDAMGIDPRHRFAYVVSSAGGIGPGGVWQYVMNSKSGALTLATFSSTNGTAASTPMETGTNPVAIAVDSSGTFVFVANQGSDSISVFMIDQIGGTLTEVKYPPATQPIPPACTANNPGSCPLSIAPASPTGLATTGNMLFVAQSTAGAGSVSTYTFDTTSGVLKTPAASTTAVGVNPSAMVMDSSGKFLFLTDSSASKVGVVSIGSSGQLVPVGTPVSTGPTPLNVWAHPSGKFLYTANQGLTVGTTNCVNGDVSAFSIDSSGALAPLSGSPFAAGPCPSYVATDSSGSFLFVANGSPNSVTPNNSISVFSIDSSGALKQVGSPVFSVVTNPVALASIN